MEIIRLVRIDFDNMENHNTHMETEVGIFAPQPGVGSAYAVVQQHFRQMAPISLYTGYDHGVYPQWRLETSWLNTGEKS